MPQKLQSRHRDRGLRAAARAAGSYLALARGLKLTAGAVSQWDRVPLRHVKAVENLTGVPRERLRPDFYRR